MAAAQSRSELEGQSASQRIPQHLFPSFSALNIHADNEQHPQGRRSGRRERIARRAKAQAHKIRTQLHSLEDQIEHVADEHHLPSPLGGLPRAMPDMRFEQSYLATIRKFVHELTPEEGEAEKLAVAQGDVQPGTSDDVGVTDSMTEKHTQDSAPKVVATLTKTPEPELWLGNLKIDWYPLLWVTFRDQVVSPLVQGTVWGLAGLAFAQVRGLVAESRRGSRSVGGGRGATSSTAGGGRSGQSTTSKQNGWTRSLLQAVGLGRPR